MKKFVITLGLLGCLFLVSGCGSKEKEATRSHPEQEQAQDKNDQEYLEASKKADEEYEQAQKDRENDEKQATKTYIKMLNDSEKMAATGKYTEAREKISSANLPGSDENGQVAKDKGDSYKIQLSTLEYLDALTKGQTNDSDYQVREEVKKSTKLENGSEKLNALIEKKQKEYFDVKASGKLEQQAAAEAEEKRVGTEGYDPEDSSHIKFSKGINNYGEVLMDGLSATDTKKVEGTYEGGHLNLAIVKQGTCIDVVTVNDDETFTLDIPASLVANGDTSLQIVPTDDSIKKGDTDLMPDDLNEMNECTIKIKQAVEESSN